MLLEDALFKSLRVVEQGRDSISVEDSAFKSIDSLNKCQLLAKQKKQMTYPQSRQLTCEFHEDLWCSSMAINVDPFHSSILIQVS